MNIKVIEYKSVDYDKMVDLRYRILREPLGLTFSAEYLEREKDDVLCVCEDDNRVIGCCILTPLDKETVQFRQMAVDDSIQKKGVGSGLLQFCEQLSRDRGFGTITLHARKVALNFYKKHNYSIIGEEFFEVGIPHFEMKKKI